MIKYGAYFDEFEVRMLLFFSMQPICGALLVHFWCTFGALLAKSAPKMHHIWCTFVKKCKLCYKNRVFAVL